MAREFKLPDIGEGISEVELLQWYVQEGDVVQEDQNLAEIETDKAVADLPSPYAGVIRRLHHQPGERIAVGSVLVSFAEDEKRPTATEPAPVKLGAEAPLKAVAATGAASERDRSAAEPAVGRVLATPATRRRARELGVDLSAMQGTGPGGRITLDDVERIARGGGQRPTAGEAHPLETAATSGSLRACGHRARALTGFQPVGTRGARHSQCHTSADRPENGALAVHRPACSGAWMKRMSPS